MAFPAEMAAAFAQQLVQLTEAVAQLTQSNAKKPTEQSAYDVRKALDRMETFDGKTEKWKEWSYKFSVFT